MSGEDDELSMDELSEITEYIQERAGDEAEVIFGQGIDSDLNKSIRVTVIATGFEMDKLTNASPSGRKEDKLEMAVIEKAEEEEVKKVIDLESGKTSRVEEDNVPQPGQTFTFTFNKPAFTPANNNKPVEEAQKPEVTPEPFEIEEPIKTEPIFEFVPVKPEPTKVVFELESEEEKKPEMPKAAEKEEPAKPQYSNDYYEQVKQKAIQRAHERFERLKGIKTFNQNPEEFKDKLETPAFVRKQVKLADVQHSSERSISRFNLTDENEFLKNNRFLHDNVD
jgi:cell division protein FtsZ